MRMTDKRGRQCDHGGEEQSDVATSQGLGCPQKLEEATRLSSRATGGNTAWLADVSPRILISDFWPPELGEDTFLWL